MEGTATQEGIQPASDEVLKAIDTILVIDHSGSMGSPSTRFDGKSRMEELEEDCTAIAREMGKYDADGLSVIAFSSDVNVNDGVTAERVAQIFKENTPRGSTNLAEALQKAVEKAKSSSKEAVVMVFTDGAPDSEAAAIKVINDAGQSLGRPKIGFVFIQVGSDQGASKFLDTLDNGLAVDVCATVKAKDAERLSPAQLVWLARNK